jgi:putative membrane protein
MIRATFLSALTILLAIPACQRDSTPPLTPAAGTRAMVPAESSLTDEQIVGVIGTANSNELQQARIAQKRARNKDVRDFARALIAHHERASNDLRALETRLGMVPQTSGPTSDLRSLNTEVVVALTEAKRVDFDRAFIAAQVGNYEEVLAAFDARLMPDAKNGELKEFLATLRPLLQSHLERALEIQAKLSK